MRIARHLGAGVVLAIAAGISGCGHHKINTKKIPAPAVTGTTEAGVASWYGDPYHGRRSASGEIFDKQKLTAAHRTLPFETWVEVTNLENGKRVDVRINDRGPFVGGRIIDLSQAAAGEIQMLNSGVARVKLRVIETPDAATVAASHTDPGFVLKSAPSSPRIPPRAVAESAARDSFGPTVAAKQHTDLRSTVERSEVNENPAPVVQSSYAGSAVSESSIKESATTQETLLPAPTRPVSAISAAPAIITYTVTYAVEAGAFSDRGAAEARSVSLAKALGDSRVVASPKDPQLWQVLVGRDLTLGEAASLANRLQEKMGQSASVVLEPTQIMRP